MPPLSSSRSGCLFLNLVARVPLLCSSDTSLWNELRVGDRDFLSWESDLGEESMRAFRPRSTWKSTICELVSERDTNLRYGTNHPKTFRTPRALVHGILTLSLCCFSSAVCCSPTTLGWISDSMRLTATFLSSRRTRDRTPSSFSHHAGRLCCHHGIMMIMSPSQVRATVGWGPNFGAGQGQLAGLSLTA
eukprot:750241-Hanusia_phi.AAC.1